jgi:hypothetical protein
MNQRAPCFPIVLGHLRVAARSAVRNWAGEEGALSRDMRAMGPISEAFLRRWLGRWRLARSNPTRLRSQLARQLEGVVRSAVIEADETDLPTRIPDLAAGLKEAGATRGLQTSLVSKFAFSLRPEVIVPYDRRARLGLAKLLGYRLPDHDYPAYLAAFQQFVVDFSAHLDANGVTAEMRPEWRSVMSERLFRMRAADKYFMLLGGFSVDRMALD